MLAKSAFQTNNFLFVTIENFQTFIKENCPVNRKEVKKNRFLNAPKPTKESHSSSGEKQTSGNFSGTAAARKKNPNKTNANFCTCRNHPRPMHNFLLPLQKFALNRPLHHRRATPSHPHSTNRLFEQSSKSDAGRKKKNPEYYLKRKLRGAKYFKDFYLSGGI